MKSFHPLSSILLTKHLVRLRDTAGEKEERNPSHLQKFMFTSTDFLLNRYFGFVRLGILWLSLKIWGVRLKTLILRHEAKRENPR